MEKNSHYPSAERRLIKFDTNLNTMQPFKLFRSLSTQIMMSKYHLPIKKQTRPGVVANACNSSFGGGISRKTVVPDRPVEREDPV